MAFPIRVKDVMSSPVQTATADTTAAKAATACLERAIGSLVVVDDDDMIGIVTSDDFVRLVGGAIDPETRSLREFMSTEVVTIDADAPVGEAVDEMFEHGIARLVVLENEELVGLVSTDDILRYVPQVVQRQGFEQPRHEEFQYRIRQETTYEKGDWEFDCVGLSGEQVSIGDRVEFTKPISEQDVRTFAAASGDTNRLHLDEEYAAGTRFGRRIAHGTLVGGLISAALARLPGLTIYVSQDLSFLSPVDIGERVTAVCEVVDDLGPDKYQLTTDVVDANGEYIIEGQAVVLIDDPPETGRVAVEPIAGSEVTPSRP